MRAKDTSPTAAAGPAWTEGLGAMVDERIEAARLTGEIARRKAALRRKEEILLALVQLDEESKCLEQRLASVRRQAQALLCEARKLGHGVSA